MIRVYATTTGVADLTAAMERAVLETRRSATEACTWAAIKFVESALPRTPVAKRLRKTVSGTVPFVTKRGKTVMRNRRGVMKYSQNRPPEFRAYPKSDPPAKDRMRVIDNRGLARSSWGWMLAKLGKPGGKGRARARALAHVRMRNMGGLNPSITLINDLGWIEQAAPGIVNQAAAAAAAGLVGQIERRIESRLRRLAGK